jgi:hypothetical protein
VPADQGPKVDAPKVKQCIGDPPRQVEDGQSPPCISYWSGDNGGKTSPHGVSADTIRIAYHGETDDDARLMEVWLNKRFQFYGRRLKLLTMGGCSSNPNDSVATAKGVAKNDIFAAVGCNDANGNEYAYYDELARQGIITINNRPSLASEAHLASFHPYEWTYFPTFDKAARHSASLACDLAGKNAKHAGPQYIASKRTFGVVYNTYTNAPSADLGPLYDQLQRCGVTIAARDRIGIVNEPAGVDNENQDTQQQTNSGVLQLKQDSVTDVIVLAHANTTKQLYPAMSAQGYQPEVILSSFLYNDADLGVSGQPKDQTQHTFGVREDNRQVHVHDEFWDKAIHEIDPSYKYPYSVLNYYGWQYAYHELIMLASGIQMAGPNLNPTTFAHGLQATTFPNPDLPQHEGKVTVSPSSHSFMDDASVMWWNEAYSDPEYATHGGFCYVNQGQRFRIGAYPASIDDALFTGTDCGRG